MCLSCRLSCFSAVALFIADDLGSRRLENLRIELRLEQSPTQVVDGQALGSDRLGRIALDHHPVDSLSRELALKPVQSSLEPLEQSLPVLANVSFATAVEVRAQHDRLRSVKVDEELDVVDDDIALLVERGVAAGVSEDEGRTRLDDLVEAGELLLGNEPEVVAELVQRGLDDGHVGRPGEPAIAAAQQDNVRRRTVVPTLHVLLHVLDPLFKRKGTKIPVSH